jgi:hypothetical protein
MQRIRCTEVDAATSGTLKVERPPTFASPQTTPLPLLRANNTGPRMIRVASVPSASRRWRGKNVGVPFGCAREKRPRIVCPSTLSPSAPVMTLSGTCATNLAPNVKHSTVVTVGELGPAHDTSAHGRHRAEGIGPGKHASFGPATRANPLTEDGTASEAI